MGRGAGNLPLYYEGQWDATLPYLPRQVVKDAGVAYLCLARNTGVVPASDATKWLPMGGGIVGSAGVEATFLYGMSAGVNYPPSADLDLYRDEGSSGVTVSGTSMTVDTGTYLVTCPAGFNALGAGIGIEVHTGYAFGSPGVGRSAAVAYRNHEAWCPGAGIMHLTGAFSFTPQVAFDTSAPGTLFAMYANVWDFEFVRLSA